MGARAEAAMLLAEGQRDAARVRARCGQTMVEGTSALALAEAGWLQQIVARCDDAGLAPPG